MIERAAAYAVACVVSPPLYALGHVSSKLMHLPGLRRMFHVYQWAMIASDGVEVWADAEIMWRTVEPDQT